MKRSVEINLDKVRHLRFDMLAKANIQQELGRPIQQVLVDPKLGEKELLVILKHGLYREDKTLTDEKVSDILFESEISDAEIIYKLFEALAESNGEGDKFRAIQEARVDEIKDEKNQ